MPERIDARPGLALIGGALVLVSLFLDWYQAPGTDWAMNAWAAFESLDLILAGAALATLYVAWEQVSGRFRIGDAWLLPLGLLVLVIVVSQILDPPPRRDRAGGAAKPDRGAGGGSRHRRLARPRRRRRVGALGSAEHGQGRPGPDVRVPAARGDDDPEAPRPRRFLARRGRGAAAHGGGPA